MNLISCNNCGVVFNKNKLNFPDIWDDKGHIVPGVAKWESSIEAYSSFVPCPVCKEPILQEVT